MPPLTDSTSGSGIVDDNDLEATADGLDDSAFDVTGVDSDEEQTGDVAASGEGDADTGAEDLGSEEGAEDQGEGEGEADPEGEAAAAGAPGTPVVKVRLSDGTEVTAEEVEKGFLRQQDYTRKTQEVAHVRAAITSRETQLSQFETQTREVLQVALAALKDTLPPPPDPALIETDGVAYLRQKHLHEAGIAKLQGLVANQQALTGRQTSEQKTRGEAAQRALDTALDAELVKLAQKDPTLASDDARSAFMDRATKDAAKHYGLSPADVSGIQRHEHLLILKDALAWREHKAKTPAAVERVRNAPPIRSAARQAPGRTAQGRDSKSWERLRREGTIEAAADALDDSLFS